MKSPLLGLLIVALWSTCAFAQKKSPATHAAPGKHLVSARLQAIGTWKLDRGRTTLPWLSAADKKETATIRMHIKADGTYVVTGVRQQGSGRWTVKGQILAVTDEKGAEVYSLTLSKNGASLTQRMKIEGQTIRITFVKA